MAAGLYELHITVNKADREVAERIGRELHWKWSQIDGDPVLGAKPFGYLTTYTDNEVGAHGKVTLCVRSLREAGVFVIREKIEHIIHDERYA